MLKFIIAFTQYAYQKFLALSPKKRQHFLEALHRNWGNNFKQMQGQPHGVFRIRFNIHERIIARLQPPYLVVTDFVSHTEMEQRRYTTALDHPETLIKDVDIDEDALNTDSVLQVEQSDPKTTPMMSQWERYLEPLEPAELYFAIYDENLHDYRISADILISHTQQQLVNTTLDGAIHIALEGGAGSGKTSVALLHALYRSPYEVSRYITYSQYLVDYSQSIVSQMMTPNQPKDLESDSSQATLNLTIQSFHALCQELVALMGLDGEYFHPSRHMTLARYLRDAQSGREKRQRARQWHEQQFIKGTLAALATADHRLPFETYYQMRSKDLNENLAADIYRRQAPWDGWDDLDITHALLDALQKQPEVDSLWDTLYCDEVQDFTEIQLYLLLRLTKNNITKPPSFFVTGDPDQILNPSGFAWKRINNALHQLHHDYEAVHRAFGNWPRITLPDDQRHLEPDQRVPPLIFTDNFRSRAPIVTLGNRIRKLAQPQYNIELKAFRSGGSRPLLVTAVLTDMLASRNIFGARDALIVADDSTLDQLIDQFSQGGIRTERVLSMTEVKGLEFDGVMVLGFFGWFEGWQNRNAVVGLSEYMVNLLYVCATRARERLIFVEETECRYWNDPLFDDCLERGDAHHPAVANFFNPPRTQEEWFESAQEFEQAGNYRQARENYERGEFYRDAQRMAAYIAASEADFEVAAAAWRELLNSSPTLVDQARNRDQLIAALKKVHPTLSSQAELAELYETRGRAADLQEAARLHQELENFGKAALLWEGSDLEAAASCYEKAGSLLDAARCWAKLGNCAQAADCAQHAGDYQGAAEYWQQAGKPLQAAAVLREGGYFDLAIAMYETQHRYATIAEIYEHDLTLLERAQIYWQRAAEQAYRQNLCDQALRYWRQIQNLAALAEDYSRNEETAYYAAECWELVSVWSAAAEIWARQSETLHRAAQAYERAEQWEQAAHCWEQTSDESVTDRDRWQQAERCWLKAECPTEAARVCSLAGWYAKAAGHYEQAVQWSEAAAVWLTLGQFRQADRCYRQQKPVDHRAIAQLWEAEGSEAGIELAIASWGNLGNENRIIELLLDQERWFEAAEHLAVDEPERAAPIYAALFEREGHQAAYAAARAIWQPDAEQYWRELVQLYRCARDWSAALALLEVNDPAAAAELYWDLGQSEAASRCWQQLEAWDQAAAVWFDTDLSQAAYLYAQRTDWLKAAALYRQAGDLTQTAKLYELAEAWALAAQTWETLQAWPLAIANWQRVPRWDRIATLHKQQGYLEAAAQAWEHLPSQWSEAVHCWLRLERFADAGRVYAQAGQYRQAAQCYSKERHQPASLRRAAELWLRLKKARLAAICYGRAGDYAQAAHIWETIGEYHRAIDAWTCAKVPDSAQRIAQVLEERLYDYEGAARKRQAMGQWQAAANLFRRAYSEQEAKPEYLQLAIQSLQKIQAWDQIEIIYCDELRQPHDGGAFFAQHGQYARAADLYRRAYRVDLNDDYLHLAIANLERLQDWNRIASIYCNDLQQPAAGAAWLEKRKQYTLVAHMLRKAGELRQAAAMWLNVNDHPREDCLRYAAECYRDNSDWSDAAECFAEIPAWPEVAAVYEAMEDHKAALEIYQTRIEPKPWQAIQRCAGNLNPPNWLIVAQASEQLGNLIDAAHAYSQLPGAQHQICAAKLYTQEGRHWQAAPIWENLEMWEEAKDTWKKAGQWQKAILICVDHIGSRTALLEAASIYEHDLRPKDFASAASLYFRLRLNDDAKRCWTQCANLTHLARTAYGEKRFAESAAMWLAALDWENAADAFVEARQYCDAIRALEHGKAQGLKPLKPRPSELPQPERFRGLGAAGLGASAGLAALLEAIALPVGIVAGLAWWAYDSTVRFDNEERAYLERLQQIADWEAYEQDRLNIYNQEATKKIARIRQQCGCSGTCPVAQS